MVCESGAAAMNIVEPSTDDLTLVEAVQIIGLGAKTLRRAVQEGHLPRRYALSPRGPQLVFARDDLTQWAREKQERGRGQLDPALGAAPLPLDARSQMATSVRVAQLYQALEQSQATLERALAALDRQQALITELSRTMTLLMQDRPAVTAPAESNGAVAR
ncbi:MAG: hypothetical protein NVSMB65_01530 [Chloroflexota bacterium]